MTCDPYPELTSWSRGAWIGPSLAFLHDLIEYFRQIEWSSRSRSGKFIVSCTTQEAGKGGRRVRFRVTLNLGCAWHGISDRPAVANREPEIGGGGRAVKRPSPDVATTAIANAYVDADVGSTRTFYRLHIAFDMIIIVCIPAIPVFLPMTIRMLLRQTPPASKSSATKQQARPDRDER